MKVRVTVAVLAVAFGWVSMAVGNDEGDKRPGGTDKANSAPAGETLWDFDRDAVDKVPTGWSIRHTQAAKKPAVWKVIADPTAKSRPNVLALTETENDGHIFNLAIAESPSFKDLDLTVQVKAVRGDEDQGGGPIWRCHDENNYYICRFNPLEGNFRVYFVKDVRGEEVPTTGPR